MKRNLSDFSDPSTFITQDDLVDMWNGYSESMMTIKEWLEGLIDEAS